MAKTGGGLRATRPANSIGNGDEGDKLKGNLVIVGDTTERIARLAAKIAGIPDNFEGSIYINGSLVTGMHNITVDSDGLYMERKINVLSQTINNSFFKITNKTGKYNGFDIFSEQVRIAKKNRYPLIKVFAAGNIETAKQEGGFNGFYTWLRFGYKPNSVADAAQMAKFKNYVKDSVYDSKTKERLLKIKSMTEFNNHAEALYYWRNVGGESWSGEFDLTDGSYSMKQITKYAKQRKKKGK